MRIGLGQGSNAKLVKVHNRALVLKAIQQNDLISRKDISRLTGLTQASITNIVSSLIRMGLVAEKGKTNLSRLHGRKQVSLTVKRDRLKVLTVRIGRFALEGTVCDLSGSILLRAIRWKQVLALPSGEIEREVINFCRAFIDQHGVDRRDILGIAVSAPGPINSARGIMRAPRTGTAPYDWRDIQVTESLREAFKVKVYADNDANVAALGESWFGVGIEASNLVLYGIGVGIGAGVIIDSMLYRGDDDVVSEIGHTTIDFHGERCVCGNIGCLELYANFDIFLKSYREKVGSHEPPFMDGGLSFEELAKGLNGIFEAAHLGEPQAIEAVRDFGRLLGVGAVTIVNMFSPELLVISDIDLKIPHLEILKNVIEERVREFAFPVVAEKVRLAVSELGSDVVHYGGVAMVLRDFFTHLEEP